MNLVAWQSVVCLLLLALLVRPGASVCSLDEYTCDNGKCIESAKFCNGINDCVDGSDEPRHCSPCNRTYSGIKDSTYTIQLHNPQASTSSFSCSLTLVAGGGNYGDLIQLKFSLMFLSKKTSQALDTNYCNSTKLVIQEPDRQINSEFCHHNFVNKPYFSESGKIIFTFVTSELSSQLNVDFKLSYKFLGKKEAQVRYGNGLYFRGVLIEGTPCSLLFDYCYREKCSLQSPNYPGVYPRNLTCYYAIRHVNSPDMMQYHALIHLHTLQFNLGSRRPGNLTYSNSKDFKAVCEDTLTVYDGYTIRDPVLISVCGQGRIDNITSSSNELLVVFHSSGSSNLPPSGNTPESRSLSLNAIQGFNILASIEHVPVNSNKFVENHNCVFRTSSLNKKSGFIESPVHSLPSNTMCVYHIQGNNDEKVWIQLQYFLVQSHDCNTTYLSIYDGPHDSSGQNNLLVKICENQTEAFRSCEYKLNRGDLSRPCGAEESYLSTSNHMTIRTRTQDGTIIDKLKFKIYYEFIDMKQDGVELEKPCSRYISRNGYFHSPKNTFLYGRGGESWLHCIYQFPPGTISLDFHLTSSSHCHNHYSRQTGRYECTRRSIGGYASPDEIPATVMFGQIRYYKVFNNNTRIQVNCFCNDVNKTLTFSSKYMQQIEIEIGNMKTWVDNTHFHFSGSYSRERLGFEADEHSDFQTYSSLSGLISLANGSIALIQPPTEYHYALVYSVESDETLCSRGMLLVHRLRNAFPNMPWMSTSMIHTQSTRDSVSPSATKACPSEVRLYSPNFEDDLSEENRVVVELISSKDTTLSYVMVQKPTETNCEIYCASISVCLPTQALCNGYSDCPDASDEANCHFNYNYEYLILIFIVIIVTLLFLYIYHNCRHSRPRISMAKENSDS